MADRPANDEMIAGYLDGRDVDAPEASANRSASYRHGFKVGRSEINREMLGTFAEVGAMADRAMAEDDARSRPSPGAADE